LLSGNVYSKNILNTDESYSLKIAVTINENDNIYGKLEYSNRTPQFPIQLVSFVRMGDQVFCESYVFEIFEIEIISENYHKIKCKSVNDPYGSNLIIGTIDFRNENEPKIHLVNSMGGIYISNISEKGKEYHSKITPNIWLGN
jgi:hypothetical protein